MTTPEKDEKAGHSMIKIEAIVREEKLEDVKAALNAIEVNGITVFQVMGCGTQKGYTEMVRGTKVDVSLLPKVKFEIVVSSEEWEQKTIKAIQEAAFTGKIGDGKIFSYDLRSAMRIRTCETGYDALN
ncbi:MAG: P-II family nitrogen regulator [Deltaproteobacteria bacterium]|jgi:nitrogen regulatory protein P-II 1|nr:P-II family nitrogen regulator [Deltaproteobacteria bacterium]